MTDWIGAADAAEQLASEFPGWAVSACRRWYGLRFEAVARDSSTRLYAVIGSYGEVRAALKAAS